MSILFRWVRLLFTVKVLRVEHGDIVVIRSDYADQVNMRMLERLFDPARLLFIDQKTGLQVLRNRERWGKD